MTTIACFDTIGRTHLQMEFLIGSPLRVLKDMTINPEQRRVRFGGPCFDSAGKGLHGDPPDDLVLIMAPFCTHTATGTWSARCF